MTDTGTGVLDTSVVLMLDRLSVDELPAEPRITTITLAELSVGPLVTDDPVEQALHAPTVGWRLNSGGADDASTRGRSTH